MATTNAARTQKTHHGRAARGLLDEGPLLVPDGGQVLGEVLRVEVVLVEGVGPVHVRAVDDAGVPLRLAQVDGVVPHALEVLG